MKFKITYFRINLFFGVVAAINLLNIIVSRLYWPTLPGFPRLIEGSPYLSVLIQVTLAATGVTVQILLRRRPEHSGAKMAVYALTVGIALAAIFEMFDMAIGAVRRV